MNPYQAFWESLARTRLGARIVVPLATAVDRRLIRWSGGRLTSGVGTAHMNRICLLSARGAKSGQIRTVPLLSTQVGDTLLVIASNGGATSHPAWYHNVTKNPEVEVELQGKKSRRIARVAEGEERERLWKAAVAGYPGYAAYAGRAEREIPVVVLDPAP